MKRVQAIYLTADLFLYIVTRLCTCKAVRVDACLHTWSKVK